MDLISTHLVKKSDLGFHANLFGGNILSWIDIAGAAYSMQVCDTPRMVTIAMDRCEFKKPAKEGQLVKIYGEIIEIGNSSIVIHIEARSHNVYSGEQKVVVSTNIKFVRIDENGDSIPISEKVKAKYKDKTREYRVSKLTGPVGTDGPDESLLGGGLKS
jgi:acyl-CoA thioesterase YciA